MTDNSGKQLSFGDLESSWRRTALYWGGHVTPALVSDAGEFTHIVEHLKLRRGRSFLRISPTQAPRIQISLSSAGLGTES